MKSPFYKSVGFAWEGIFSCVKNERNIKIHIFMMFMVIIFGIGLKIEQWQWIICLILFGIVIALELVNTAIEAVVDLCSPDFHPLAKYAKDVAAGAVLVMSIFSALIGLIIFIPKIWIVLNAF